jgi:hypothetical protein
MITATPSASVVNDPKRMRAYRVIVMLEAMKLTVAYWTETSAVSTG